MFKRVALTRAADWLRSVNSRHPWSHNDYFHSWVLANLPDRRRTAVDVGCGRGGLVERLAPHFERVVGTDTDDAMRVVAQRRVIALNNVSIGNSELASWPDSSVDLITMIAVLHHLDVGAALAHVRRVLASRGRFLVVGLAVPRSVLDHVWEAASVVSNPLIGLVHHPWPNVSGSQPPPFPVRDPTLTFAELADCVHAVLPEAVMRHRIGFRHTIEWTKTG